MDAPLATNMEPLADVKLDPKTEAQMAADAAEARGQCRRGQKWCALLLAPPALFAAAVGLRQLLRGTPSTSPVEGDFDVFAASFGKEYPTQDERDVRFAIFKSNHHYIQAHNSKDLPYTLELNEFADLTADEFRADHLGLVVSANPWGHLPRLGTNLFNATRDEALAASVDWVHGGAVTIPKNQGHCGSCWTFSTTGAIEGAWKIAGGGLVSLSEQQFVDCSLKNKACKGGSMDAAFEYAQQADLCTEESYPYVAKQDASCSKKCTTAIPAGSVTGFFDVPQDDENSLMKAVMQQPVSVGIEGDKLVFQLYHGGVMTQACGRKLDHGVLVVGYGVDGDLQYWKIKNSWGPKWGEAGFIRIQRNLPGSGKCGISTMASYPIVKPPAVVAAGAPQSEAVHV